MTRNELMDKYRISESTLWKLMYKGKLPYYKLQRKVLFKEDEIEEYFNSFKKVG
ncbi:helix-turn-helix transcriptional regulator [Bacteroidota bacterium]